MTYSVQSSLGESHIKICISKSDLKKNKIKKRWKQNDYSILIQNKQFNSIQFLYSAPSIIMF